eukprot:9248090-Pyramimonas_sp.AAC.1
MGERAAVANVRRDALQHARGPFCEDSDGGGGGGAVVISSAICGRVLAFLELARARRAVSAWRASCAATSDPKWRLRRCRIGWMLDKSSSTTERLRLCPD